MPRIASFSISGYGVYTACEVASATAPRIWCADSLEATICLRSMLKHREGSTSCGPEAAARVGCRSSFTAAGGSFAVANHPELRNTGRRFVRHYRQLKLWKG